MKTVLCFLCFSLIGWIGLFIGLVKTRRYNAKAAVETARAEGVIIGYEQAQQSAGRGPTRTAYYPIVRFTADSHEYVSTSEYCFYDPLLESDKARPPEGSVVGLYYNPANPFKFHLEQDVNDEGRDMIRIARCIIAISAAASIIIGIALKW